MTPTTVPMIAAAAAEDVGAADHHRGDRGQQVGVAHALVGLGRVAGEQHAGERGAEAGDDEGADDDPAGADAGEVGGALAVAGGVDRRGRRRCGRGWSATTTETRDPDEDRDRDAERCVPAAR